MCSIFHHHVLPLQVVHCPRLMDTVFRDFLPLVWSAQPGLLPRDTTAVHLTVCLCHTGGDGRGGYGLPQPAAMRLVQAVCSASSNLTSLLVSGAHTHSHSQSTHVRSGLLILCSLQLSRHKLLEVIVRYTVPHPSELSLPLDHAHSLSTAALHTGRVLLHYGVGTEWLR